MKRKVVVIGLSALCLSDVSARMLLDGTLVANPVALSFKSCSVTYSATDRLIDQVGYIGNSVLTSTKRDSLYIDPPFIPKENKPFPGWRPKTDLIQLSSRRRFGKQHRTRKNNKW